MSYKAGRHFLQLPGPTNTPERVLRAMSKPTIDHRGPEFQELTHRVLEGLAKVFKTEHTVVVYPASGSGAWEATVANALSPGDRVVSFRQGFFAGKWADVARRFGVEVDVQPWDLRRGVTAEAVTDVLAEDADESVKAVLIVHNETSTGVTTDIGAIGRAMRESGHPAMLFVDAVSSLAATDLRHDEWGLDVTLTGSQKGLMLPPGLAMVAVSPRAMEASRASGLPVSYWSWSDHLELNARGFFPYTPATHLLYGLDEALQMLEEEGLDSVFARHQRFARATRAAVDAWGLEDFAAQEAESSAAATAVLLPDGHDADGLREVILDRFDMSLGTGLGEVKGKVFRIGHLGDLNALMLSGTLAGVEMGLRLAGVPHQPGGVQAAMEVLCEA